MDYRKEIVRMIEGINEEKYLQYIYILIKELLGII